MHINLIKYTKMEIKNKFYENLITNN